MMRRFVQKCFARRSVSVYYVACCVKYKFRLKRYIPDFFTPVSAVNAGMFIQEREYPFIFGRFSGCFQRLPGANKNMSEIF